MIQRKDKESSQDRRQRERRRLCLPGETEWEVWQEGVDGRWHPEAERRTAASASQLEGITHYAFPVAALSVSPFWAVSEDADLIPSIVVMRLESLGLKPEPPLGKHWDYRIVEREEKRSLILATVLEDGRAVDLPQGDAGVFDLSASLYPVPRNHLVLWRELGRWVAAVTRNGKLVYSQALSAAGLNGDAAMELKCLILQLQGQAVIDHVAGVVVWDSEPDPEVLGNLAAALGLEVRYEPKPQPLMPEEPLALLPRVVAEHRQRGARHRRIRNGVMLGSAAYLLAVAAVGLLLFLEHQKTDRLHREIDSLDTAWILETQNRWNALQPAIDGDRYPVELLYRIVDPLGKGVRLLQIDIDPKGVFIRGEATNPTLARTYQNKLIGKEDLEDYEWTAHPPKTDPETKVATFEIEGDYLYAATESE